ncbi:unnamed protein product [Mytilus coruscus]|uniref:Uncharacterized protein n=1 Tax=Mytilus coruscus TaxID=42192 RepID=A0A6J8BAK2_MYTCO|nr:unnamed protein product [Mytilus coruscus]
MERLPSLLTSTIQNACEQFRNITFTVHGENDKARISIMFTNQESIKSKRKSNSTIKRDNKRLREYNENNSDTIITECATNTQCSNNADNCVELVGDMDVEITPNGTPTTLTGEIQSAENVNIDLCVYNTEVIIQRRPDENHADDEDTETVVKFIVSENVHDNESIASENCIEDEAKQDSEAKIQLMAKENRRDYFRLEKQINTLCEKAANGNDIDIAKLESLRLELSQYELEKCRGAVLRSKAVWAVESDRNTKYFFKFRKYKQENNSVKELLNE